MTQQEFQTQINRLVETYGKGSYGTERTRLLWAEFGAMDAGWFRRAVDGFIGESRTAPMISDFRAAAQEERRRSRHRDASDLRANASDGDEVGRLHPEDVKAVVDVITRRMSGRACDGEFASMVSFLAKQAEQSAGKHSLVCSDCSGTGLRIVDRDGYSVAHRCECISR